MVGGRRPLKDKFFVKMNQPLTQERMPSMQINNEISRISYLHRNDYNAV